MISTSPRHAKHARVATGAPGAPGVPEAAEGVAGPRRRRRIRSALIVAPVTAVLVAVGLVGMHVVTWRAHTTADASRQSPATSVVNALPVALSCCRFPAITGATASPPAKPWRHTAKPSVSPRPHAAVKATASASASAAGAGGATAGTGGDGSSPPGSVAGWRLTYSTDFPGSSLPSGWLAYNGEPGGDPDGNWEPSNVTVSGDALHLLATPSGQGGVQFYGNPQTYGMYMVRMKGDYEPGLSINNLAILWPAQQGVWPPEVDFFQDAGGSRQTFSASLHVGPDGNGSCCVIASPTQDSNATAWHTYGVEWTPDTMTYTIDGQVWASVSRSSLSPPAQWPTIAMNLTLQSQNQDTAQPSGTIETMTVAWVAEYAMSG
jgi:Glycosyl hydrolases family 16